LQSVQRKLRKWLLCIGFVCGGSICCEDEGGGPLKRIKFWYLLGKHVNKKIG